MVREFGADRGKLRLEITETVMMTQPRRERMAMLESLRKNGFIIEMDDFGSGYSSLNMLKDMPVDVLKIDMASLRKAPDAGGRRLLIVREIINLARELDMISLTEGVETKDQLRPTAGYGVPDVSGLITLPKPMPPGSL